MGIIGKVREINDTPGIVQSAVRRVTALLTLIVILIAATFLAVVG